MCYTAPTRRALLLTAALTLCSCGPLLVNPALDGATDKVIVLYIGHPDTVGRICAEWNVPGSVACVSMATNEAERAAMLAAWQARVTGIDCVVVAPAVTALIEHEVTLCGTGAAGYWNKGVPPAN